MIINANDLMGNPQKVGKNGIASGAGTGYGKREWYRIDSKGQKYGPYALTGLYKATRDYVLAKYGVTMQGLNQVGYNELAALSGVPGAHGISGANVLTSLGNMLKAVESYLNKTNSANAENFVNEMNGTLFVTDDKGDKIFDKRESDICHQDIFTDGPCLKINAIDLMKESVKYGKMGTASGAGTGYGKREWYRIDSKGQKYGPYALTGLYRATRDYVLAKYGVTMQGLNQVGYNEPAALSGELGAHGISGEKVLTSLGDMLMAVRRCLDSKDLLKVALFDKEILDTYFISM